MKAILLVLALSLSVVSAKAEMDITTCNSELLKRLNEIKKPTADQRGALTTVQTIQNSKVQALSALATKLQAQADVENSSLINAKARRDAADMYVYSGKVQGYTAVLKTTAVEISAYIPCLTRLKDILNKK